MWQSVSVGVLFYVMSLSIGKALLTFRFQFFYLQYLLPLLGAVLVYLGCRSLRLENSWFRLGWLLSALLLASHMALDVRAATPVMAMRAASPAVDGTLTWLLQGASLLMLLALWLGSTFGTSFLPPFNEDCYTVFVSTVPGTSLDETERISRKVMKDIEQIPGVLSVTQRTGRAENDEHAEPGSASELLVRVDLKKDQKE